MLTGADFYVRLFGNPRTGRRGALDHASLPNPRRYLGEAGLLVRNPKGAWAQIRCPVHKRGDEHKPSMGVSLVDGHFKCHTCGAKGGDIIALHRLISGKSFRDAVADLGGRFHD